MAKITHNDLSSLLLSVYRAARELPLDEFQRSALDLIQPWLKFDSCRSGASTVRANALDNHYLHLYREPPDIVGAYEEVKHQDNIAFSIFANGNGTYRFNTGVEYRGRKQSGIRDYAQRFRHANALISAEFSDEGKFVRWASLYRARSDNQFSEEERQLCASLFPHMLEALAINRLAHLEHLDPAGAMRRYHLAIADRRGILYHSEPGFLDLLSREAAGTPHKRLPEALLTALQSSQFYKGRTIMLLARPEGDLLFLKARSRVLADGLSSREIQVAREVAKGHSYKEIARNLQVSPSTARNHIHAIHAKLQVDNKASLTAQLMLIE